MVSESKILTVSYGTFSCTLEGFDDPFSTMKSIAEYFRDLAAGDRFFGAEPPTPDVEMLHRIAEREIKRRVEARIAQDGVVLRQLQEADAAEIAGVSGMGAASTRPEAPAPAFTPAPAADRRAAAAEPAAPDADDTPAPDPLGDLDTDAADPAMREAEAAAEDFAAAEDDGFQPDEGDGAFDAGIDGAVEDAPAEAPAAPDRTGDAGAEGVSPEDTRSDLGDPAADAAADDDDAADEEEAIAAQLARIRAVVAEPMDAPSPAVARETSQVIRLPLSTDGAPADPIPADTAPARGQRMTPADEARFAAELDRPARPMSRPPLSAEERARRHRVVSRDPFADDAYGKRIVEETDEHFSSDESSRRRSAIMHLRAAVAATKADKILRRVVGTSDGEAPEARYRDDLAQVVRPRPTSETMPDFDEEDDDGDEDGAPAHEDRATTAGAEADGPLMLVSSLRVTGDEAEAAPEAPSADAARETATGDATVTDAGPDAGTGFVAFARQVGAENLTDLLEAAAAYSVFVEGESSFSRPQIMRQVAVIDPRVELSREAGLRSFGQLLRQGRIQKLKRGQFMITEDTRFHPEHHRFAGE